MILGALVGFRLSSRLTLSEVGKNLVTSAARFLICGFASIVVVLLPSLSLRLINCGAAESTFGVFGCELEDCDCIWDPGMFGNPPRFGICI